MESKLRVLLYTPTNARAVDLQSVLELFVKMGHEVHLLSQLPEGPLHRNVKPMGVHTHSFVAGSSGMVSYYRHAKYLARFIKKHRIDVVFAHLQAAGLATGIARKLTTFNWYYVRHNTDEHKLQKSRNAAWINYFTNKLAPAIIAPSEKVYRYLVETEKINPVKIIRINYGYNFSQYLLSDKTGNAAEIRAQYPCRMLLVSVARLIPVKRHMLMFDVVERLRKEGADIKMICLSDGPFRNELQQYINDHELDKAVFLLGARSNVFDYLEAGDVFFHLSATEASNSAVKEAGYCKKTAIVCNDVGDFDDYIENGINGFIADKQQPVELSLAAIRKLYNNPGLAQQMGQALHDKIVKEFAIENVAPLYEKLFRQLNGKKRQSL